MMEGTGIKSRAEIEQAFNKIKEQYCFEGAHLELSTDDRVDDVVAFVDTHLLPDETMTKALEMTDFEEFDALTRQVLADNLSVLLVSDTTNEILGARLMNIMKKPNIPSAPQWKNPKMKKMFDFLVHKDDEMDIFRYFGVDVIVQCYAMGVHRGYRGRGYASKLMEVALQLSKEFGLDPVCMRGKCSSNYTKRIFEKCGFETIHELVFDDYKINGEVVFKNTGVHKSTKIYVKKL